MRLQTREISAEMRVYFAPCGIALGHAGRAIPVARTFCERGHSVYFSTYGDAVPFVRGAGFEVGEAPAIKMFEKDDGTFNFKRTLSTGPRSILTFTEQVGAELTLMERFKSDIVISDSRLSTIMAARMRRITPILILHQLRIMIPHVQPITRRYKKSIKSHTERLALEILGRLWRLSKVIVVPDFPPPYTIAKANVVPSHQYLDKLRVVGPIIPKLPSSLPPADEIKRSLGFDDRPLVLAAISGTPAEKMLISGKLVKMFREFPDRYNIVLTRGVTNGRIASNGKCNGSCNGNGNGNGSLNFRNHRLNVYDWIDDRYSYLKACDLLITRGGHNTVSEAVYYGKPMVVIPTPGHSEHQGIAKSLSDMQLAIVQQQSELNQEGLKQAIGEIVESSLYASKIKAAQNFASNFNAIESIYKIACDALGEKSRCG